MHNSPRNQYVNPQFRKEKGSPILRNSDQGQRIHISPNYNR